MSRAAGEGGLALSLPTLEHAFMLQLVTSSRVPPARLQKLPAFFTEMRKQPKYQVSLNLVLGAPPGLLAAQNRPRRVATHTTFESVVF